MSARTMGLSCSTFVLIVFNTFFIVLGVAGAALGIWMLYGNSLSLTQLVQTDDQSPNCKSNGLVESAGYILVVAGITIVLVGLLGFLGAYKKSRWMLYMYGGSLIVIFSLEIATVITASAFEDKLEANVKHLLKAAINSTFEGHLPSHNRFTSSVNYAQIYLQCCGVDSYTNFWGAEEWNQTTVSGEKMVVPLSCCKLNNRLEVLAEAVPPSFVNGTCTVNPTDENSYKDKRCWPFLVDFFTERIAFLIGLAAAIFIPELLCLISAYCVLRGIPKKVHQNMM